MKNLLDSYQGKDKKRGRPIRLNIQRLKPIKGKDYASVVFFGDLHYGARECDVERAKRMLDYCLEKKVYVFLMGDMLECATRYSVGSGVYEQINPQGQVDFIIELLRPLAKAGLILGNIHGNHEDRVYKETGINVTKVISNILKVPYLGSACWNLFYVGNQSYTVYSLHGASGSRYVYTKLKALVDISHNFDASLIVMGHVHDLADTATLTQYVNRRNRTVEERKKFLLITGHYLRYDQSYAQAKGMPMGKHGSPKVKFYSERKDLHVSY